MSFPPSLPFTSPTHTPVPPALSIAIRVPSTSHDGPIIEQPRSLAALVTPPPSIRHNGTPEVPPAPKRRSKSKKKGVSKLQSSQWSPAEVLWGETAAAWAGAGAGASRFEIQTARATVQTTISDHPEIVRGKEREPRCALCVICGRGDSN
ncbi:hypothetical protein M427DRAFT_32512 [Gonapodya prolifera JEL478]|uniref:Uncharacterized protein n=1 Tax=Gonapodya prolifera (strain JEL478) TaxID=1344416 RepID=A0A139AFG0_GONPJ|nr:hypothetical protein M427DRAFT_32512 [Gonapodya prolifera JEL478]|eukprot:KXS15304.1 hypothetical protein M427DRAFT_32512 [Gonapodya prolifera JEL478]